MKRISIFLVAGLLAGCECAGTCDGLVCGACPEAITLDVVVPGGAVPEITGTPTLECRSDAGMTYCFATSAEPGEYTYTVSAAGRETQSVTLTVGPGGTGCCACAVDAAYARVQFEILDAAIPDAATPDAATSDAGSLDAGSFDAGASCDPDQVEFPMGGELSPGTLCDDVFVCIATDRIDELTAASFDCSAGDPCGAGLTQCSYQSQTGGGPSILDEAEIADICAVTALEPPPESILCRVYL